MTYQPPLQYELRYGAAGVIAEQVRLFPMSKSNDATTRFAQVVAQLDADPEVGAGYVHLRQVKTEAGQADPLLREAHIIGWTKTSNETPTTAGEKICTNPPAPPPPPPPREVPFS